MSEHLRAVLSTTEYATRLVALRSRAQTRAEVCCVRLADAQSCHMAHVGYPCLRGFHNGRHVEEVLGPLVQPALVDVDGVVLH